MSTPIMTHDLALQLEQSKGDHIESWVRGMQKYAENPFGADLSQVNDVRIFAARHLQEIGLFNVVIGLGSGDKNLLPKIIQFYHDRGIEQYRLEINPYQVTSAFLTELSANGFALHSFQTYVYGVPTPKSPIIPSPSITVHDVAPSEVEMFADLHIEGFREALSKVPEQTLRLYRECTKVLFGLPGWYLHVIRNNTVPSGMGMLYIQDGKALLAGGATLSHMRVQGGQTASLHHRLAIADQNQCNLISGQTSVGSSSQRNMQRFGMQTAYTGTIWVKQ